MSITELRKRLIDKIEHTDDNALLEEAYRLLEMQTDDLAIFTLNDEQKKSIADSQLQIKSGQSLTDEEANNEIEEWLKK